MADSSISSTSISTSTLGSSPLHRLAGYFKKARKRVGTISLPKGTLDTIKKYREEWSEHSGREVDAIVRALEPDSVNLFTRLDSMALVIICSILVHTEPCLAQQRGLCLLAETLYGGESTSSQATAERQGKKIATGQQALIPMVKSFVKIENPEQTRRWFGVVALELLKNCEQNVALLQDDPSTLQSLNEVIEHGSCQMLKLLAGSIIHTMLRAGVMPELVWPTNTQLKLYSQFPRAQHYDTQWINAFEGFIEGHSPMNPRAQERSCVIFAFALIVGNDRHNTNYDSAILVTVSEDLSITIPNPATGPATYIDVPLEHIKSAIIDSQANSQSQTPSHVLILNLSDNDGTTCYFNASANNSSSIALVFAVEDDAKTLLRLIRPEASNEKIARHYSQSEAIDVSQAISDDFSEDELADPSSRNDQELRIMANRAASLVSRSPPARTGHPTAQVLPTISQRPGLGVRTNQQSSNAIKYVERSISVAMGVDVSQPSPQSNPYADVRGSREHAEDGIANRRMMRTLDRTAGTGLPSSLQGRQALINQGKATESRNPNENVAEQQAAEGLCLQEQAEDYDSTYEVSPKTHKSRLDPVKLQPLPLRSPNGVLNDHHHMNRGVNSEAHKSPSIGPAPSQPQQSRESRSPIIVPRSPNAGVGSTDKSAPTKLSKRLRNIEGGLENDIGLLSNHESHSLAVMGAHGKKKQETKPKRKAAIITKTRAGVRKQAKPAQKPAVKKANAKVRVDVPSEEGDEYDLEASPEPPEIAGDSANAQAKMPVRGQAQPSRSHDENEETSVTRSGSKASHLLFTAPAKAKTSKARPQKDDEPEEKSIWKSRRLPSDESYKGSHHKRSKQADNLSDPASKEKKAPRSRVKSKPKSDFTSAQAPVALMQPKSRRAAAIKANKKLQGLEDDEITDVDDPKSKLPTMRPSGAVEKIGNASAVKARINDKVADEESTAQAPLLSQSPVQRPKSITFAEDNVKADAICYKISNTAVNSKEDISSPEKIDLIQESLVPPSSSTQEGTRTRESFIGIDPGAPAVRIATVRKDLLNQGPKLSANNAIARRYPQGRDEQPKQPLVSDVIRKAPDEVPDTDESMASNLGPGHYLHQVEISMMGDVEDSHFQEAMPETDGGSSYPDQAKESLDIAADTKGSDKLGNVRSLLCHRHDENVAIHSPNHHNKTADPFKTKLDSLVIRDGIPTDQDRAALSLDITQSAKGQITLQANPTDEFKSKSAKQLRKAKEAKETAKHLMVNADAPHVRLPQSVAPENKDPIRPTTAKKRSVNDDNRIVGKITKVRAHASTDVPAKASRREQATNAETPLPVTSLKTGLISWTVSGPRNQGIISAKKTIHPRKADDMDLIEGTAIVELDDKKRIAYFPDDAAYQSHDHHAQRQDKAHMTPRHNTQHMPPMKPVVDVSAIHERAHRISSQSTKVDENGSPIPFTDLSRQGVQQGAAAAKLQSTFNDDEMPAAEDDLDTYEPQLPSRMNNILLDTNDLAFVSMASNSKQIPSSPHAPSTHAAIPPHVVLHSGELVNERTLESIVPTLPQDPFVGGDPKPPSSFMNLLHKSAAVVKMRESGGNNKENLSGMIKRKPFMEEDDPDKTLVEPEPKRQKKHHHAIPESPSTFETTSRANTLEKEWSDQDTDSTTTRWRKTLEPHQNNMLEVLSHLTHRLVRHLVSKETAAEDIVDDFRKGGNLLLEAYEKGRRQLVENRKANLELSRRKLAAMYTQTQANVLKVAKDMSTNSRRGLEASLAQRHHQQNGIGLAIEKAIAACE